MLNMEGFPNLAATLMVEAAAVSVILHAWASFKRPKYVEGRSASQYFIEHFGVSERELEVVAGLLDGQSNGEIAEKLFISPRTVENHLYRLYGKIGIKNRLQLFNLLRSDSD